MALILRIGILNLGRTTISKSLFILPERSLPFSHRLVSLSATTATTDDDDASSVRAKFKEVPINSSVLEYIQRLRIGRPKKSQKRRRKKSQPRSDVLSLQEEKERFRSSKRFPSTSPPPPFPSTLDDKTDSRKTIKRYPVKLLGSIGSSDEEFPKETPGLPEVVRFVEKEISLFPP